jgi:hypothetical protein
MINKSFAHSRKDIYNNKLRDGFPRIIVSCVHMYYFLGNEDEIYLQLLASFLGSRTKNRYDNQ